MEAAIYAKDNDERAFAEALARLMDDADLRRSLGRVGRQRIEASLSWMHQRGRLLAVYRSLDQASGLEDPIPDADKTLGTTDAESCCYSGSK
jgi:hypothetical protein